MAEKIKTLGTTAQKLAGKFRTDRAARSGNKYTLSAQVTKAFLKGNSNRSAAKNIKRVNLTGLNKVSSSFYYLAYSRQDFYVVKTVFCEGFVDFADSFGWGRRNCDDCFV